MPTNTSASGGYLLPDGVITAPIEDDALDDFFGDLIAGVTGLDRNNAVRPRWQPEPANLPDFGTDWVAQGIVHRVTDTFPVQIFDADANDGDGAMVLIRHEVLDLLCSFYGPHCQTNGALLRDGLFLGQNREGLFLAGMGLVSVGDLTKSPDLIKNRWVPRCDLTIVIRREIRREYGVITIETVAAEIIADPSDQAHPIIDSFATLRAGMILDFEDPAEAIDLTIF